MRTYTGVVPETPLRSIANFFPMFDTDICGIPEDI